MARLEESGRSVRMRRRRRMTRNGAVLLLVTALYYVVPVGRSATTASAVLAAVGVLAGAGLLAWLITRQVTEQMRAQDSSVAVHSLLVLLYLVVAIFALGYYVLERGAPGQFAELHTRTDALYFTVATLATVGFGDVHPVGQVSRALVTVQMAFDLVFVGALVAVLSGIVRARTQRSAR
jgi:voltage-gated potassium channel